MRQNNPYFMLIITLMFSIQVVAQSNNLLIISLNTIEESSKNKEHLAELKSAYYNWIYQHHKISLLNELINLYEPIPAIAANQYETGEISLLRKTQLEAQNTDVMVQQTDAIYDFKIAENELKNLLLIQEDILPDSDSLVQYTLTDENINNVSKTTYDTTNIILQNNITIHQLQYQKEKNKLVYLKKKLILSKRLKQNAQIQLTNEEIDYVDYVCIITSAIQTQLLYLDQLNKYNQKAIEIEYFLY